MPAGPRGAASGTGSATTLGSAGMAAGPRRGGGVPTVGPAALGFGVVLGHLLRAVQKLIHPQPLIRGRRVTLPPHEVSCDVPRRLAVEQRLHPCSPPCPGSETGPGAGGASSHSWKGLSRSMLTCGLHCIPAGARACRRWGFVMVKGPSHRGCSLPMSAAPWSAAALGPHLEHRIHSACVELRLARLLRRRQELTHLQLQRAHVPRVVSPTPVAGGAESGRRGCAPQSIKKGVSPSPRVELELLMANTVRGSCWSQSSLCPLAKARSVSPMTLLARSTLALVFLWYAEATMRHEPMLWTKARNIALVNLGL
jgi:hypothetical protein